MKIRSLITALGLFASVFSVAQAQEGIEQYSGVLRFTAPLTLSDGHSSSFQATLRPKNTSEGGCQIFGKLWPAAVDVRSDLRVLVVEQGSVTVVCEGKPARQVLGDFIHSSMDMAWQPPQKTICMRPGSRSTCLGYATVVEAGTYGGWTTWQMAAPSRK